MTNADEQALGYMIPEPMPASTGSPSIGIERLGYVAMQSPDPQAAARFAATSMGFDLVHVDDAGRHYLAAAGLDPYSLVYVPGEANTIDHISYVVADLATLTGAQELLSAAGVACELEPSQLWRHEPALRFRTPNGHPIELSPGVHVPVPMAAMTTRPTRVPGPIASDHVMPTVTDQDAEIAFALGPFGLRMSCRIDTPDGQAAMAFFRCHTLYHCWASALAGRNGLHHIQFTHKDVPAILAAHTRMAADPEVEVLWGPVRHAPGHNVAFYFKDYDGNIIEYSAEEEIILDDDSYAPQRWTVLDQRSADEWGTQPPPEFTA